MPIYRFVLYKHGSWVNSVSRNLKDDVEAFELAKTLIADDKVEGWRGNKLVFSMNKVASANPTA